MREMRTMGRILVALAAAALGACSSLPSMNPFDWFGSSSGGPKPAELPALTNAQGVRVMWSSSIGSAEQFILSPALSGDSLYVASRSGSVASLDPASGQPRWRVSVG